MCLSPDQFASARGSNLATTGQLPSLLIVKSFFGFRQESQSSFVTLCLSMLDDVGRRNKLALAATFDNLGA